MTGDCVHHKHVLTEFNQLPPSLYTNPPTAPSWVTFRPARASDLKALHENCFADRPLTQFGDSFRRALAAQRSGRSLYLIALVGGAPIASGQVIRYSNSVEIADLVVAPDYRGQGLGTALIDVLSRVARYAGYDSVEICVMRGNSRARALYERLGFVHDRELTLTDAASVDVLRKELKDDLEDSPGGAVK